MIYNENLFGNFLSPLSVLFYNTYFVAYQQSQQYSQQMNLINLLLQQNYNCFNNTNDYNKETNEIKGESSKIVNEKNCSNKFIIKKREREKGDEEKEEEFVDKKLKMENNKEVKDIITELKCCNSSVKRQKKKNQKIKAQELLEDSLFLNLGNNTNTNYTNYYANQNKQTHKPRRYNKNKKRFITSTSSHSSTTIPLDEDNPSSIYTTFSIHKNNNYKPKFSRYNFMKYNFNITKEKHYTSKKKPISKIKPIPNLERTFFLSKNNSDSIPNQNDTLPQLKWSLEKYQNNNKYSLLKCLKEIENKWIENYNINYNEELALYLIQYNNYSYDDTIKFINNSKNFSEWLNRNNLNI